VPETFRSGTREPSLGDEGRADCDDARIVEREDSYRSSTDISQPNERRILPREMVQPSVPTRVVEPDEFTRQRIDARDVRTLTKVASNTAERAIRQVVSPAMLACDNVVDLVFEL
jgi:hypothetical protein